MSTLVGLLQKAQEQFGARTALIARPRYKTERWSYHDLWRMSGQAAAYMHRQGMNRGDRVILWAHNSPQWVAAFFGCLRAGAIAVPLDVRSSVEFVHKVVERTQPKLACLSYATAEAWGGLEVPVIRLEEWESSLDEVDSPPNEVSITPGDIAEIMFTSGTTGDPKGVILTHGNIVANVKAARQMVASKPGYRLLSLLPLSHMLEQTVGLLAPLSRGASIYYLQSRGSTAIFRAFKEQHITTLVLVPQALQLFMTAIDAQVDARGKKGQWHRLQQLAPRLPMPLRRRLFAPVHRQLGGSLEFFMCGGAYLDPALARKWEALGIPVLQGYGTTEAAPIISCNTLQRRKLESVGMPLPGVEVKISDEGEVLVRGDNITPGYWQNPQATDNVFNDGWYMTGDLGFLDQDGFLYLRGRQKDLIVLSSGLNVYPEDIETVLKEHPEVSDAVVVGLPRQGQEVQVHSVLLLKGGQAEARPIIERANAALAEHQRIQGFTVWPEEDFPRTHTLKVKKHQVLEQLTRLKADERPATAATGLHPSIASPLVQLLARLARVQVDEVQASMTLGDKLGLDSLARVELLAALETELGVELDESQISAETTVDDLKAMLTQAESAPPRPTYWEWPLNGPVRVCRAAVQFGLAFPLLRLVAPQTVDGREHLRGLLGPVLFAANHLSHLDTPVVLAAMPPGWRFRTAVAAAADFWFSSGRIKSAAAALLFNAFPFSRGGSIRPSLERCSYLLDRGWSVLIYPEGSRSDTGLMGLFKSGTGLMSVELGVPLVPVHIQGTFKVLSKGQTVPRRGEVRVRFGKPLRFPPRTSYLDATRAIEEAVKALGDQPPQ